MRLLVLATIVLLFSHPDARAQNRIIISKELLKLYVVTENGDTLLIAPIGCGKNYGNKQKKGDNKTPEGTFVISQIQNSSSWVHDFKDGNGETEGAYGPYFLRLKISGFFGIGIHGTCFPESIGTRCSEGCIRMNNADLLKLRKYVCVGTKCTILPDVLCQDRSKKSSSFPTSEQPLYGLEFCVK